MSIYPGKTAHATLGQFDLIIGSDILYERDHAQIVVGIDFAACNLLPK